MGFKTNVLCGLNDIRKRINNMSEAIDSFITRVNTSLQQLGDALTNIAADEANLASQIAVLTQQIADLVANGGTIGAEDLEKLTILANAAQAMADRTKGIADSVPDPVVVPV